MSHLIPTAHYKERHAIHVETTTGNCWSALQEFNLEESKLISLLFFFRGLQLPALSNINTKIPGSSSWIGFFLSGFHPIIINAPNSLVLWLGLTLPEQKTFSSQKKFFKTLHHYFLEKKVSNSAYEKYLWLLDYHVDIGWDFQIVPVSKSVCILSTETRVYFRSKRLKRLFLPYWIIIRIFSGVIRLEMLRVIRNNALKK